MVIIVTAVIAGAGTLPALLLRPSPDTLEPMSAETARELAVSRTAPTRQEPVVRTVAVISAPALAMIEKAAELAPATPAAPASVAQAALPTPTAPAREATVVPEQPRPAAAAKPIIVAALPEAPAEAPAAQKAIVLPPVQPAELVPTVAERSATRKPQVQAAREGKRKQGGRPAPYPIREFLAWRR